MVTHSPERAPHNDSVREASPRHVEPASFSGHERMNLYQSFDSTVGAGRNSGAGGAGGDANLPTHFTFDNSIYQSNIPGAGIGGDASYKVASLKDTPAPEAGNTQSRVGSEYMKDAGKFAFGDTLTDAQAKEGKDKLQVLTEEAYRNKGEKGLRELAGMMSDQAVDKYGNSAFDKAPSQFKDDVATVQSTPNKDGSTQVQYNFAQPNSDKVNSVIFQLPKPELGTMQPEYFPDNGHDTYKI